MQRLETFHMRCQLQEHTECQVVRPCQKHWGIQSHRPWVHVYNHLKTQGLIVCSRCQTGNWYSSKLCFESHCWCNTQFVSISFLEATKRPPSWRVVEAVTGGWSSDGWLKSRWLHYQRTTGVIVGRRDGSRLAGLLFLMMIMMIMKVLSVIVSIRRYQCVWLVLSLLIAIKVLSDWY